MAIFEIQRRESTLPVSPRKALASFFSFSKTNSSLSSSPNHLPPPSPSQTFSESMMEEDIENAKMIITKWDLSKSSFEKFSSLFQENRAEAQEFIKCVKDLRRAMDFLISKHSSSNKLVLAQKLMQIAMKRLEKEFHQILSSSRVYLDPESVSSQSSCLTRSRLSGSDDTNVVSDDEIQMTGESISEVGWPSARAMSDLKLIADSMIGCGYGRECMKIYRDVRKSTLDEGLFHLGIARYSSSKINKMNADVLEDHVKRWADVAKTAITTLVQAEKLLCDGVFFAYGTIKEACFTEISRGGAINLFRFPELVAKRNRSPHKVVQLMKLCELMLDIWPDIDSIFCYEPLSAVKLQALSSLHKLGESIQTIISDFESSIQKNSSRILVLGGGIHPLTKSVINFVSLLADHSGVLSEIVADSETPMQSPFLEFNFESPGIDDAPTSAVSNRIGWIILILLCKLDSKANLYNDIALSYLFLANNLQFVLDKVRTATLKFLLGDDWLSKLDSKVKLYAAKYEAVAWSKVLSCPTADLRADIAPDAIMGHFRKFNLAFEEAYRKQASWVVPDAKLRDEIKVSIARKLVPVYRELYDAYFTKLVRFAPDNLENCLSDLFHGTSVSSSSHFRVSKCLP